MNEETVVWDLPEKCLPYFVDEKGDPSKFFEIGENNNTGTEWAVMWVRTV